MDGAQFRTPQIKIGVIGTSVIIERFMRAFPSFPTFDPVTRTVEHEGQVQEAAIELAGQAEVLMLSGALSHRLAKEAVPAHVPVHYVPLTGAGLYKALFHALRIGKLDGGISVDSLTEAMVSRTLKDLELQRVKAFVYDGPAYAAPDKLVRFHRGHTEAGRTTIALTGVEAVSRALSEQGIANEWLLPSEQDIIVALERALLASETRRSKESQIVVGIVNVDDFGRLVLQRPSEHEVQRLKLDIHRTVLEYVESLDGHLTALGGDEYLFVTTRGIFERETGGYKTIQMAKDAHQSYGISLSLGVGFGVSANEAGTNARAALMKAKQAGGNACFIVREDRTLIGPLEMADPVQTILTPTDASLIKRAEDAGMTSAYLSKLLGNMARIGKYEYKVHELSALLGITVRSAHRLLLQWIDGGLVEIAGMEKVPKGRPRQIFRFRFLLEGSHET